MISPSETSSNVQASRGLSGKAIEISPTQMWFRSHVDGALTLSNKPEA